LRTAFARLYPRPTSTSNEGARNRRGPRDGMMNSGMAEGLNQSYAALDRLLATLR
jgi:hypothetical protein